MHVSACEMETEGEMNRGRENVTETECAVACAAVNIAGELRYARKAAPAIWPRRLHPSPFSPKLLLALSNSPLRTLTHTCSKYETVCASCVCEPICVSVCVCVGGVLAASASRV